MVLLGVGIALVVLVVGACVVGAIVIYANDASREFVSELTIDFSDGVPAAQAATCEVAGLDFADDYEVFATVTNVSDVESHYLIDYELFDAAGASLGTDFGIVSNLAPGASERDDTEGVIDGATPWTDVDCEVLATTRVAASG